MPELQLMKSTQCFPSNASFTLRGYLIHTGVVKGTIEESKSINAYLANVRLKLNEHYRLLIEANKSITAQNGQNAYINITEKDKTIIEVFQYHNNQVKELLNKDFSFGMYEGNAQR